MMRITPEQVEEYRGLYQNKFGKPIESSQARDELTALVCFIGAIHRHVNQHDSPGSTNGFPPDFHEPHK